eukprot:15484581-Alexandrium_andersonii.AAC.1
MDHPPPDSHPGNPNHQRSAEYRRPPCDHRRPAAPSRPTIWTQRKCPADSQTTPPWPERPPGAAAAPRARGTARP